MVKHLELIDVGNLEILVLRLLDCCLVVDVKLPLDPLISGKFKTKVFFLEMQDHRDHLNEVMAHILVGFYLFFHILSSNVFC